MVSLCILIDPCSPYDMRNVPISSSFLGIKNLNKLLLLYNINIFSYCSCLNDTIHAIL